MTKALYIHIPFCEKKCNYCDFLSFPKCSDDLKRRYVEAMKKEVVLKKKNTTPLKSIFFGGGTPTCLSGGLFLQLIEAIKEHFILAEDVEISTEANPGTVDYEKLSILKNAGVNRISFGVQTFDEKLLKRIGRIHSPKCVYDTFSLARKVGFSNINLDLMYGLPGQNLEQWEETLQKTIDLNPEHISLYQLKIEKNTPLGKELKSGKIEIFDDEIALEMYKLARKILSEKGYEQYEISNFAKKGYRCIHNQVYWRNEPYFGLGLGAHFYEPPVRYANVGTINEYIDNLEKGKLPPIEKEMQDINLQMSETMFMGLRLIAGVDLKRFEERFKKRAEEVFKKPIAKCSNLGLIEIEGEKLRFTEKGLYIGNLIFEEFLLPN